MIGSAVCTAASDAQETSGVRGCRVYAGSGGTLEVTLLAMAAVGYVDEFCSVLCRQAVAGGEVCYYATAAGQNTMMLRELGSRGRGKLGGRNVARKESGVLAVQLRL